MPPSNWDVFLELVNLNFLKVDINPVKVLFQEESNEEVEGKVIVKNDKGK